MTFVLRFPHSSHIVNDLLAEHDIHLRPSQSHLKCTLMPRSFCLLENLVLVSPLTWQRDVSVSFFEIESSGLRLHIAFSLSSTTWIFITTLESHSYRVFCSTSSCDAISSTTACVEFIPHGFFGPCIPSHAVECHLQRSWENPSRWTDLCIVFASRVA